MWICADSDCGGLEEGATPWSKPKRQAGAPHTGCGERGDGGFPVCLNRDWGFGRGVNPWCRPSTRALEVGRPDLGPSTSPLSFLGCVSGRTKPPHL